MQVTSEHKVYEKSANGNRKLKWVPKYSHADNHFLDCEVYAMAAAEILGVRSLHLDSQKSEEPKKETKAYTPEEDWIMQNENWL